MADTPSPAVLARAFELWGGDARDPRLLGGSNCWVYSLERAEPALVLRLTPDGPEKAARVQAELDWLTWLALRGAPVCAPYRSRRGRLLERLGDEPAFLAAAFHRARGWPVNSRHPTIWGPALFETCGKTLGELHALSKDFVPSPGARRAEWDGWSFVDLARRTLPAAEHEVLRRLERSCEGCAGLPRGRDDFGLIHGDFHQGNYQIHEGRLEVFDFDDCAYGWYAWDVAVSVYTSLLSGVHRGERELAHQARTYFAHFARGYVQRNRLEPDWIERLPDFLQIYNLLIFVSFSMNAGRAGGRVFDFVGEHARSGRPCFDVDFRRLYEQALRPAD